MIIRSTLLATVLALTAHAALADSYSSSCRYQRFNGESIYSCTYNHPEKPKAPPPINPLAMGGGHGSAGSDVVRVKTATPPAADHHRPGCNVDGTICLK